MCPHGPLPDMATAALVYRNQTVILRDYCCMVGNVLGSIYQRCSICFSYSGLLSKYPAGLNSEPVLSDLMKEVAAEIPGKWRDIGLQLGLNLGVLERIASISPGDNDHCFSNVFTQWKSQSSRSHPYTWLTVVQALQSPAVGESKLANKVMSELSSHPFTTGGVKGELLTQSIYVISFPSTYFITDSHIIMYINKLTTPQDALKRLVL